MARAVLVDVAHHLTQRGLDRARVFTSDIDREVYLGLVSHCAERFGADLLGYCLMSNHVHWVAIPRQAESLARTFGEAHGRYAAYANAKQRRSGHFWQNRFFSCALDEAHLWAALRYVERNPVRAGLARHASEFVWSSAATHTGLCPPPNWLQLQPWCDTFTPEQWDLCLKSDTLGEAEVALRRNTYTGRPSGSEDFVRRAEATLDRSLAAKKGGRPAKASAAAVTQGGLFGGE